MVKRVFVILQIVLVSLNCMAELRYREDGKFKIAQFTDLHIKYGNPMSDVAIECINEVLDAEKPDLVVFTGDIIYASPAREGLSAAIDPVVERDIPFVVTLGNHDDEQDMTRKAIYSYIREKKGNVQNADEDYSLPIYSNAGERPAAVIYCIDSHSYSKVEGMKYAWHTPQQVAWYAGESQKYTDANNGIPLPSIAFFHIPLKEFADAVKEDGNPLIGVRREKIGSPLVSDGLFAAFENAGDVMGCIVGHEHNNDFSTLWHNIVLAYGRYSGGNTVYNHLSNGARIIELKEGKREFDSWIRLRGGQVKDRTNYPGSYYNDNWRERTEPLAPGTI